MLAPRQTSEDGAGRIASWEGWSATPYKDCVGVWTWGYGHARIGQEPMPSCLTKPDGLALLKADIAKHTKPIDALLGGVELTQHQYDALASWLFNVGPHALAVSGVRTCLLRGDYAAVPAALALWCKAGGVLNKGLLARRRAEGALFTAPDVVTQPMIVEYRGPIEAFTEAEMNAILGQVAVNLQAETWALLDEGRGGDRV